MSAGPISIGEKTNWGSGSYLVYLSPWGAGSLRTDRDFFDTATFSAETFPNALRIDWSWPDVPAASVYNFDAVSFGNYYDTAVQTPIISEPIRSIALLAVKYDIATGGDPSHFDVITDLFLTAQPGDFGTQLAEVEIFAHAPAYSRQWFDTLRQLGNFTVSGQLWHAATTDDAVPVLVVMPEAGTLLKTSVDIGAILNQLVADHALSGDEYFNGLAFGAEVRQGTGALSIGALSFDYVPGNTSPAEPSRSDSDDRAVPHPANLSPNTAGQNDVGVPSPEESPSQTSTPPAAPTDDQDSDGLKPNAALTDHGAIGHEIVAGAMGAVPTALIGQSAYLSSGWLEI